MLDQLQVQGFKAIFNSGPVSLQPLTLFIGRNGSGKSSLLEGLQWVQEAMFEGLHDATARRFDSFDDLLNRRSSTIDVDLLLDKGPSEVRYKLEVKAAAGTRRPIVANESCREQRRAASIWTIQTRKGRVGAAVRSLNGLDMNPVRDGNVLALAGIETRRKTTGAERLRDFLLSAVFLRLSPTALARPDDMVRGPGSLVDDDGRGTVALLSSLDKEQLAWVTERISAVISGVKRIEVKRYDKPQRGYIELQERMVSRGGKKLHAIPSWLLSEGSRRLVTLFALLARKPRPSLIAVEEIENGLDPWTLQYLFEELRSAAAGGVQILLTTHSPFLLDHVQPEDVVRVQREEGNSTFRRATEFETIAKYQGVVAPGAMYLSGFLEDRPGRRRR